MRSSVSSPESSCFRQCAGGLTLAFVLRGSANHKSVPGCLDHRSAHQARKNNTRLPAGFGRTASLVPCNSISRMGRHFPSTSREPSSISISPPSISILISSGSGRLCSRTAVLSAPTRTRMRPLRSPGSLMLARRPHPTSLETRNSAKGLRYYCDIAKRIERNVMLDRFDVRRQRLEANHAAGRSRKPCRQHA
jgi:hypothetical protein